MSGLIGPASASTARVAGFVPEPYRILFPLGVAYTLIAALVWPLWATGWIPYPAPLHWTLMIQGFLQCFVLGFLLTALPAFLHSEKVRPMETAAASACMVAFGTFALAGSMAFAQVAYLGSLAVVVQAGVRRLRRRRGDPPEEFLFVALGVVFAVVAAVLALLVETGSWTEPAPRFVLHLLTKGMMLSIVLGVGGLLVPTFSAMREPLVIPGLARPGERRPRRRLYVPLAALLVVAAWLDATGQGTGAAWLRVMPGTAMALLVWKIHRKPGRPDLLSWTLWSAGWLVLLGLWIAAIAPARAVLAYHVAFLGGFGLLILGIATRVVVSHGGYPMVQERRVLQPASVVCIGLALLARVGAEFAPASVTLHYGLGGALWIAGWLLWSREALPRMLRRRGITSPQIPSVLGTSPPSPRRTGNAPISQTCGRMRAAGTS